MSVSDVLSTTLAMLRSRGIGLVAIWLGFIVLIVLLAAVFFGVAGGGALLASGIGGGGLGAGAGLGFLVVVVAFYFVYILVYMAQSLAMAHYASPLVQADIGASFGVGFRRSLTMLGLVMLLLVLYFVAAMVFAMVAAALGSLADVLGVVLGLAMIPVGIYFLCRLSILLPVVAVDGVGNPASAISRSWRLTSGNVLAIFLALLAYIVAAVVVFGAILAIFTGSTQGLQSSLATGGGPGFGAMAGMVIIFAVVGLVFAAAGAALMSAIHSKLSDMGAETLAETFG